MMILIYNTTDMLGPKSFENVHKEFDRTFSEFHSSVLGSHMDRLRPASQFYYNNQHVDQPTVSIKVRIEDPNDNFLHQFRKPGGLMCLLWFAIAIIAAIAAMSLYIYYHYGHDQCLASYGGIGFDYVTWLIVYGYSNLALIVLLVVCVITMTGNNILGLGYLFQFAWWIVGIILYFKQVNATCQSGELFHDFAFASFIAQTVIWGFVLLWGGHRRYHTVTVQV